MNVDISAETYNETLSNFAAGVYAQGQNSLAEFIAPTVSTGGTSGEFLNFNNGIPFQYVETKVEDGTSIREVKPNGKYVDYNLDLNALKVGVTDWAKLKAGTNSDIVVNNKIQTLLTHKAVAREFELTQAVDKAANKKSVTWLGTSGSTVDIIESLDEYICELSNNSGGVYMPNRMVIPLPLWIKIKNHTSVRDRIAGIKTSADLDAFASLLANPMMQIKIGTMAYNAAAKGKVATNMTNIYGSKILLFHADDAPTTESYSFMHTFMIDGNTGCDIHSFPEKLKEEHVALWAQDIKEVCSGAGLLINVS